MNNVHNNETSPRPPATALSGATRANAARSVETIRCAIVGAGAIARQHINALQSAGVRDIHVYDLSPAAAEATAERFALTDWHTDLTKMLTSIEPHIVHVTTPAVTHAALARTALQSGADVLVEKPITTSLADWRDLRRLAAERGRWIVENQNYIFNRPVRRLRHWADAGRFGEITHVEVACCLNLFAPGSAFADANMPHPALGLPGGAVGDFLTHLASLVWIFLGPHHHVQSVWRRQSSEPARAEMRAIVQMEAGGTAALCFSTSSQPDQFTLRVYGTRMTAVANLFEGYPHFDRPRGGPRPLTPLLNGVTQACCVLGGVLGSTRRKLSGVPTGYDGLWELVQQLYRAHAGGEEPPIAANQIDEVNQLVHELLRQSGLEPGDRN